MTKPPGEYSPQDSWNENGVECCAVCGSVFDTEEIYTAKGERCDTFMDADPDEKPYFCVGCWVEADRERKRRENKTLGEYA